jgi:hypothetical protein
MKPEPFESGHAILLEGEIDLKNPQRVWSFRTQFPMASAGSKTRFRFEPMGKVYTLDLVGLKSECDRRIGEILRRRCTP